MLLFRNEEKPLCSKHRGFFIAQDTQKSIQMNQLLREIPWNLPFFVSIGLRKF